jgi:hypothetical protein
MLIPPYLGKLFFQKNETFYSPDRIDREIAAFSIVSRT